MSAQSGRDLLLKIERDGTFVTIGGLRAKRMIFDAQSIDVTDAESTGRWRELLAGSGVRRASVSGAGLFKDGASDALVRETFFSGAVARWQFVIPALGTLEGPMQVTRLEYAGAFDGEITFELALESAGAIAFHAEGEA